MEMIEEMNRSLAGRYLIEREIGAGGMATVYLARDVRHNRPVALKVLKPELGALLGVERFLSEIQVTANLQHPNLLALFDSGEANGRLFYVMPFVEGESLRARLERERQLPVHDAIRIATAVAGALDYAHRHGVIHRDLKPENILLHDGQPLVADFGIALAVSNAGGARMTQTGISLGTPQYMSPEQATGDRVIDGRSDIYSLGAVTYELLTGEAPHAGNTAQAIIAKVLTEPVKPVRVTRPLVPEHVDEALERALAKLPADRWSTAQAFADALDGRSGTASDSASSEKRRARRSRPPAWNLASPVPWAVAFGLAAVAALWGWRRQALPTVHPVTRFTLQPASGSRFAFPYYGTATTIAISPDGRRVVYSGTAGAAGDQLYLQALGEMRPRALAGTEGALFPEFSPDGQWIAYVSPDQKLRKMPVDGGAATTLCDVGGVTGLTWLSGETLVFAKLAASASRGLWQVSTAGGEPQRFTSPDSASGSRQLAIWLPRAASEGRLVFFTISAGGVANAHIGVARAGSASSTTLDGLAGSFTLGLFDGHLLYVRSDGSLMAAPFDERSLRAGPPVLILDSVAVSANVAAAAVSANGSLAYIRGSGSSEVVSVDLHGQARVLMEEKRAYAHPRLSPDGRRIAFDVARPQGSDVWLYDFRARTFERLSSQGISDRPEWTPDGKRVLFSLAHKDEHYALWWKAADASAPAESLYADINVIREGVVTPDGRAVVYREDAPRTNRDIYLLPLAGDRKPIPLLTSSFDELMPRISPDGKWLAYLSDEFGQYDVFVRPLSGPGAHVLVSSGGGMEPLWSPDGRRIYYRTGRKLVAATVESAPAFAVTGHELLFEGSYQRNLFHPNYDVARDGKSFVMLRSADDERQLVVVLNWMEELRQRTTARR